MVKGVVSWLPVTLGTLSPSEEHQSFALVDQVLPLQLSTPLFLLCVHGHLRLIVAFVRLESLPQETLAGLSVLAYLFTVLPRVLLNAHSLARWPAAVRAHVHFNLVFMKALNYGSLFAAVCAYTYTIVPYSNTSLVIRRLPLTVYHFVAKQPTCSCLSHKSHAIATCVISRSTLVCSFISCRLFARSTFVHHSFSLLPSCSPRSQWLFLFEVFISIS